MFNNSAPNDQLRDMIREIVREEIDRCFRKMAEAQIQVHQWWIDEHTPKQKK